VNSKGDSVWPLILFWLIILLLIIFVLPSGSGSNSGPNVDEVCHEVEITDVDTKGKTIKYTKTVCETIRESDYEGR